MIWEIQEMMLEYQPQQSIDHLSEGVAALIYVYHLLKHPRGVPP